MKSVEKQYEEYWEDRVARLLNWVAVIVFASAVLVLAYLAGVQSEKRMEREQTEESVK